MTSSSNNSTTHFKRKTARIRIKSPTYVNLESSSEEKQNKRTPSPPPRDKSLSRPQAPSKSTSSRSTSYNTSSLHTLSPSPTQVAPPPKLRIIIPMKIETKELPQENSPPPNPHVSNMEDLPPRFAQPLPEFEHPLPPQPHNLPPPLFVNINNNVSQQEHLPRF
ncbi:hypothetical protein Tco_1510608 [Tanacetum coccineum]